MVGCSSAVKIAQGFEFLEGPVWLRDSDPLVSLTGTAAACLIFSDIPASAIYWYRDGLTGILRDETGQANGNTLDTEGRLLSCEHENRRVSRMDASGTIETVASRFDGARLNSPNDVVVRSDGLVLFTDPPYGVEANDREIDVQGLYCVNPGDQAVRLLHSDFERPNGLAFSPDERRLFVADTERGQLVAFSVDQLGNLSGEEVFCRCDRPDGLRLDQAGNVWVACLKGVEVFSPTGQQIAFFELPERPANLVFGDADCKGIYVCARTSVYYLRSSIPGYVRGTG